MDDLIQGNADLTETQLRWIENLEVGEEMRVPGGMEGGFFVRRLT